MLNIAPWLSFSGRPARMCAALALACLAGCTSTSTIDTAFADLGAAPAGASALSSPAGIAPGAPLDTGVFPNINEEPPPAATHITDAERTALLTEMEALRAALLAGRVPPEAHAGRLAELERLAATHSDAALRRIEGGQ